MVGFIDSSQDEPPPALGQAYEVLRFLARSGNSAAEQRLQDISQSCSHVWPTHIWSMASSNEEKSPQAIMVSQCGGQDSISDDNGERRPSDNRAMQSREYPTVGQGTWQSRHDESQLLEPWETLPSAGASFGLQGDWNIDLSGEAEGIYSSFHNPTLALTGVDYMDWLEIEKVLNGPDGLLSGNDNTSLAG